MTVDAHLRALAAEVDTLAHASEALRDRVQALRTELDALALSLRPGGEQPPPAAAAHPSVPTPRAAAPASPAPAPVAPSPQLPARGEHDLDGARLVALNMALEGHPRERTDAYLAERFQLDNRAKLLDEVYAAVEE